MQQEAATCCNIKDVRHRNKVKNAIKRLLVELKGFSRLSSCGLVLFATPEKAWSFIPEKANNLSLYRCEKTLVIEPLLELIKEDHVRVIHILLVSGEEVKLWKWRINQAKYLTLPTKSILTRDLITTVHSFIRNAHGRGGFSANRYARLRDNEINHYIKDIVELHNQHKSSCDMTILLGAEEKIDLLRKSIPSSSAAFVTGNPLDSKVVEAKCVQQISLFWKQEEEAVMKMFHEALRGNTLVFGKDCPRAMRLGIVQRLFTSCLDPVDGDVQQIHVIYGYSSAGQTFCRDFQQACLLFPGSVLEEEEL